MEPNALPPGLAGYVQGQQANQQEGLRQLQMVGAIQGILSAQEELKRKQRDNQMGDAVAGGMSGGGVLSEAPPQVLRAIGTKLAMGNHPGAGVFFQAADRKEKTEAEKQQMGTLRSTQTTIQPDPQEIEQSQDQATPAPQAATVRNGGLFSSLLSSPYVGREAATLQSQVDNPASGGPESFMKHYERLAGAHRMGEDKASAAADRQMNLPKSTVIVQDKASPTGWSHRDTRTGEVIQGAPPPSAMSAAPSAGVQPQHADVRGADYLAKLDPGMADLVKGVAEGRVSPTAASMRTGDRKVLMQHVLQYDPSYTEQRAQVRKDFTSGKTASNITAMNTVLQHMGTVDELTDALKNKDVRAVNSLVNKFRTETGKAEVNSAEIAIQAMGNELMRVFRQVGASQHEVEDWVAKFNAAKGSPEQLKGALKVGAELMNGRLEAVNDQWKRGMGSKEDYPDILSEKSRGVLDRLRAKQQANATPSVQGGPYADPDKERAYQEWKARQPK